MNTNAIRRPPFFSIPVSTGLKMTERYCYQEKLDGVWSVQSRFGGDVFAGEQMDDGRFVAFDCLSYLGEDIQNRPLRERLQALESFRHLGLEIVPMGHGGEFLEHILARGGEGMVVKDWDSPFGSTWTKCKRLQNYKLLVAEKNSKGKSSVRVMDHEGVDCGWVPCRKDFERLQVGDLVEVLAYGRHASGKLREPRMNPHPN